jgi:hypothetical protein
MEARGGLRMTDPPRQTRRTSAIIDRESARTVPQLSGPGYTRGTLNERTPTTHPTDHSSRYIAVSSRFTGRFATTRIH